MPRLTINGTEVEVPEGTLLIEACALVTEKPPHFCYHPGLKPDGNCRMCMVKVEGMRGVTVSCTLPAGEGMVVHTEDPEVIAARKGVMEFLLIHHPLDCPVCDKAGECTLQDNSFDHGPGHSRFVESKQVRPKRNLGEKIALWPERCIRCSRCIRFLNDVPATGELGFVERGDHTDLDVFPGRPIDNPMSLNIVDICPVGALISKDFLFQARVWNMRKTDSVCAVCSRGCNVEMQTYEGKVTRIVPRHNEAVNGWWMCDHGRLSHEYFTAADRPKEIRRREDARTYEVSAGEGAKALAKAVKSAREAHGDESIAMLVTAWATNEELWLAGRYAREVLGAPRLAALAAMGGEAWEAPSGFKIAADKNPNRAGLEAVLGLAPDVEAVKALAGDIEAGKVKVLVVLGGIPSGGYPDELTVVAGKLDFLAVLDVKHSDLIEKAHLTLPGATHAEKNGSFVNEDGRVQRLRPALTPPFPGGDLGLLDVLLRAGGDTPPGGGSAAGIFAELAAARDAFEGLTFNDLGESGAPLAARETV